MVLDIVFVYNFRMGVAGAAIATDIAQAGSFVTVFDAAWDSRKWAMDDISGPLSDPVPVWGGYGAAFIFRRFF